jgi:hypothetical protein
MYTMTPPAVFVSDRVLQDEECMRRLHAFVKATDVPDAMCRVRAGMVFV